MTRYGVPNATFATIDAWAGCKLREGDLGGAGGFPYATCGPALLGTVRLFVRPSAPWYLVPVVPAQLPLVRPMGLTDTADGADRTLAALVPLAAAGDDVAFTSIVRAYHADMTRVAYVICGGDRDLAEDAVQSAWTIAWKRLGTVRDPCRVRAWLLSVAANEGRQLLRSRRRVTTVGLEFAEERVGMPDAEGSVSATDVAGILARLSPDERALVALRYVAGYDSAEIGTMLGISASGVRSRLERLLDRVRRDLAHD